MSTEELAHKRHNTRRLTWLAIIAIYAIGAVAALIYTWPLELAAH